MLSLNVSTTYTLLWKGVGFNHKLFLGSRTWTVCWATSTAVWRLPSRCKYCTELWLSLYFLSSFKVLSAFLFTPTTVSTSFVDAAEKCRRGWYGSQAKWHEVQIWGIHRQGVMLAIFILFCLFCPTNYLRNGNFQGPASHGSNKPKVQVVEGHFFNSSGKITPMEHEKQAFERVLSG